MSKKPTTKKEWRALAEYRGKLLDSRPLSDPQAPLTFDNLTVCFSKKEVTFKGRLMKLGPDEPDCITFPVTSDMHILERAGWYAR